VGRLQPGDKQVSTPERVAFPAAAKVWRVSCGQDHFAAVDRGGTLYTWGLGGGGRLGHGSEQDEEAPWAALTGQRVAMVSCGAYHTTVVTKEGQLWTWGDGEDGQLSHGKKAAMCRCV
jgi:alpha-tubulin suppressor-like RCC1 family protein